MVGTIHVAWAFGSDRGSSHASYLDTRRIGAHGGTLVRDHERIAVVVDDLDSVELGLDVDGELVGVGEPLVLDEAVAGVADLVDPLVDLVVDGVADADALDGVVRAVVCVFN